MRDGLDRFKWERLLISERGPCATARLVGLVLATHMNKELVAWPSIQVLSKETGLSDRAVGTHLQGLEDERWIARSLRGEGKGWRNYLYRLTCPKPPEVTATRTESPSGAQRARAGELASAPAGGRPSASAVAAEHPSHGAEPDSTMVSNDVPTNSEMITSNNTPWNSSAAKPSDSLADQQPSGAQPNPLHTDDNGQGNDNSQKKPSSVVEWAAFLGLTQHPGEHWGQFQSRVVTESEHWKHAQTQGGMSGRPS
jgi:predicted transcriptional regulator